MPLTRNTWRPASTSHIVLAAAVDRKTAEMLINACPAGLFSQTPEGELRIDFHGCLECGTCRILSDEKTLQHWRYPESGYGLTFRFG